MPHEILLSKRVHKHFHNSGFSHVSRRSSQSVAFFTTMGIHVSRNKVCYLYEYDINISVDDCLTSQSTANVMSGRCIHFIKWDFYPK